MYTFLLIIVLCIWYIWHFHIRIPRLRKIAQGDGFSDLLQLMVVTVISSLNAMKVSSYMGKFFIFLMTFCICIWMIQLMLEAMLWLQAYSRMLTLSNVFTIVTPIIILWHMPRMRSVLEIELTFMTLLLSTGVVYGEVIRIVTKTSSKMSKGTKIKGILTWLTIILINLYTLLVFVQFYMGVSKHHFIEAEYITEEAMTDLLYYLIVTFTTVGFGDISPDTMIGKIVTCIIALSGMLFTGMFIGAVLSSEESKS